MEKNKDTYRRKPTPSSSKIKNTLGGMILGTLLFTSCQENKIEKASEPQENRIENVSDSTTKNTIIQEPWEYKIYKLGLGSIVPIKGDIQKAKAKIENTPKLSKILKLKDIDFETILPSIIKESMMNSDAKSSSGAIGYFQLKPIAVKDIVDFYKIKDLEVDANDPVDNIILGSLYRIRSLSLLKEGLNSDLSDNDLEKMMILSYNAGPARIKKLFRESKAKNYKEFEKFLAKKIGVKKNPVKKLDKTYGVEYIDPLTDLDLNKLKTKEDKKIAEGLRYVAIINGISGYIKSSETIKILGKITCDKNITLFSEVKKLRNKGVFKKDASINDICKKILESNGYGEKETPKGVELLVIENVLTEYLP